MNNEFIAWELASRDTIDFKMIYVDISGDVIAGLLLSQIIFWNLPDKKGDTKLKVLKKGKRWLAKQRAAWWDEIRITPKQYDRAVKVLVKLGIVEVWNTMFNGYRTPHIWLNMDKIYYMIKEQMECSVLTKGKDRYSPKGNTGIDQKGTPITETTTETTTEITYNAPNRDLEDPHSAFNNKEKKKEVLEVLEYYYSKYSDLVDIDQGHPRLKPAQRKRVEGTIGEFMQANRLDVSAMRRVVDGHFERHFHTDWNINHFATEGVLEIAARDAGYG